jgi:hypothetical protein
MPLGWWIEGGGGVRVSEFDWLGVTGSMSRAGTPSDQKPLRSLLPKLDLQGRYECYQTVATSPHFWGGGRGGAVCVRPISPRSSTGLPPTSCAEGTLQVLHRQNKRDRRGVA